MSPRPNIPVGRRRVNASLEPRLQNVGPHIPVVGPLRVCTVCSTHLSYQYRNEKRPRSARSITRCETCEVHLCLDSNSNCCSVWHTQQILFSICYGVSTGKKRCSKIVFWIFSNCWLQIIDISWKFILPNYLIIHPVLFQEFTVINW